MIIERKQELILMEVDRRIEKMIEKYHNAFIGDRIGEVENAEKIYDQAGRQAGPISGEVGNLGQLIAGG